MSDKQVIKTSDAPQNDAPYSQGILTEDFLFVSGQGPADPETGNHVKGGVQAQTEQTLKNIQNVIKSADGSLDDVVKTTMYLDDIDDYDAANEVYGEYFDSEPPARVCIEASRLPGDIDIEIEAFALVN